MCPNQGASSWKLRPRAGLQGADPQGAALGHADEVRKGQEPRPSSYPEPQGRAFQAARVWSPRTGCPALLRLGLAKAAHLDAYGGRGPGPANLSPSLFRHLLDADTTPHGQWKGAQATRWAA